MIPLPTKTIEVVDHDAVAEMLKAGPCSFDATPAQVKAVQLYLYHRGHGLRIRQNVVDGQRVGYYLTMLDTPPKYRSRVPE